MELAPRYCRSCGSRILIKNVCHNCNKDPLKGENYCYDCGSLTPNPNSCLNCGARYKRSFPLNLALIIGSVLLIAVAATVYFLSGSEKTTSPPQEKQIAQSTNSDETRKQELPQTKDTIVNKPIIETKPAADTTTLIVNKPKDTTVTKPLPADTTKKTGINIFSSREINGYKVHCAYFGNQRSQILFFIANESGYIKVNGKIVELQRKSKGVDQAVFEGPQYKATLTIEGLTGSEKEWLASCTLTVKDLVQNKSSKHKVYSSCIEL
jgi:hypothetical protein